MDPLKSAGVVYNALNSAPESQFTLTNCDPYRKLKHRMIPALSPSNLQRSE